MPSITVFTPAYNRAHLLERLHYSLEKQASLLHEWIIVDDGSTDHTQEIIRKIRHFSSINIKYIKQHNQGKHIAINTGVTSAEGELFFIVDSDDILPENSLALVKEKFEAVRHREDIAGVVGRKGYLNGSIIGTDKDFTDTVSTTLDMRLKNKIVGDMAEVYRTEVMRKFPFPKFEGEKFCPEALVWQQIDQYYRLLWFNTIIYLAEYQPNGISSSITGIRMKSPAAAICYYSNLSKYDVSIIEKLKAVVNYWRFRIYLSRNNTQKPPTVSIVLTIISLPISLFFIIKDNLR